MNRIGIDLGGTKIEGIMLNESGSIIERKRIPTNRNNGYEYIIDKIINLISDLQLMSKTDVTVGICTPGAISPNTGKIKNSNTVCLIGKPFKEDIESNINCKIKMDNDANCFTLGESYYGQGKQSNYVLGLTIGTGLGSSLVINKRVYRGHHNGIELGHILIKRNHSLKHLEYYLSGTGLTNLYLQKKKQLLSTTEIIKRAQKKELIAQASLKEFYDYLKLGIINAILGFDPDIVIVGGGISQTDLPWKKIFQEIKQSIPLPIYQQVKIVCSKAPNKMTLLGVSLLTKKY